MSHAPIVTVTLNPALDVAADSPVPVVAGPKLRLGPPRMDPGGGGVNVARAIHRLGAEALPAVALAGPTGDRVAALLRQEGLNPHPLPAPGETRQCLTVTERATGQQFRFVLPGDSWQPDDEARAMEVLAALATPESVVVLSGSQPPGVAEDFPARLARALRDARLIVDTSGTALQRLVEVPTTDAPYLLRMDEAEAEALAGGALKHAADTVEFAQALVARGVAQVVVVARGADGSVLAHSGDTLHCVPPRVEVDSKVGAGDSFTGALALALARGEPVADALRLGVAAAAAAVMTPATELFRMADVERILPLCEVRPGRGRRDG